MSKTNLTNEQKLYKKKIKKPNFIYNLLGFVWKTLFTKKYGLKGVTVLKYENDALNGSFLKLKNAEIGYSYKNMRFYVSGTNLLTFSKFDYWDPEMGGGSGLKYPTQRVFNFGFQMTFK